MRTLPGRDATMGKRLRIVATMFVGALGIIVASLASPSYAATTAVHCESGANLQTAINSASPGATLSVTGKCVGNFVVGKNLKLTANTYSGAVTLDGNQAGSVVMISSNAVVTITGFRITNGLGDYDASLDVQKAGGVTNLGKLTLNRVVVTGNGAKANNGVGGISTWFPGTLTMNNSTISANTAGTQLVGGLLAAMPPPGGVSGPAIATLNNTIVSGNTGGVGGIATSGPIVLSKSSVIGNTGLQGYGIGGVQFDSNATFTSATISGNLPCNFACPNG
jgi:hypothetical protein